MVSRNNQVGYVDNDYLRNRLAFLPSPFGPPSNHPGTTDAELLLCSDHATMMFGAACQALPMEGSSRIDIELKGAHHAQAPVTIKVVSNGFSQIATEGFRQEDQSVQSVFDSIAEAINEPEEISFIYKGEEKPGIITPEQEAIVRLIVHFAKPLAEIAAPMWCLATDTSDIEANASWFYNYHFTHYLEDARVPVGSGDEVHSDRYMVPPSLEDVDENPLLRIATLSMHTSVLPCIAQVTGKDGIVYDIEYGYGDRLLIGPSHVTDEYVDGPVYMRSWPHDILTQHQRSSFLTVLTDRQLKAFGRQHGLFPPKELTPIDRGAR